MNSIHINKNLELKWFPFFSFLLLSALVLTSCNQDVDTSLKADLTAKAMAERDFQGVYFTVQNAVVTLSGNCPTQKAKDAVEKKVKNTYRVKQVINTITIANVTIGTDDLLKHSIDSVLQQYAGATAITKDSVVYLQGTVTSDKEKELTEAISGFKPKDLKNNLSVK